MYKIVFLTFIVTLGLIVGCSSKGSNVAANPAVLDVGPAPIPSATPPEAPQFIPPAEPAFAAAPVPVAEEAPVRPAVNVTAAPVIPAVAAPAARPAVASKAAPSGASSSAASGKYTVKKGDTLFSIAKTQLGTGGQWKTIVAANPGLSPKTLKAGQQIALPQ